MKRSRDTSDRDTIHYFFLLLFAHRDGFLLSRVPRARLVRYLTAGLEDRNVPIYLVLDSRGYGAYTADILDFRAGTQNSVPIAHRDVSINAKCPFCDARIAGLRLMTMAGDH